MTAMTAMTQYTLHFLYTARSSQQASHTFYSLGARVDFDVVDDELREALDDHVGECCSHHHWGRALLKLHLLNVHGLRGGKVELWDARPHQRSQVFKCLKMVKIKSHSRKPLVS